jgi:hypothetical protein
MSISPAVNIIQEECKHTELETAKKISAIEQEERKKSEAEGAKKI